MNDLLKDSFEIPRGQASRDGDIELGAHASMNSGELGLENFFKKVQEIEKQNEKLDKLLKKLQDANEESKAVTKAPSMKSIKQRMEKDVDEVGKVARWVKSKIEELDKENLANRQKAGCGKGTGVDRSRTATTLLIETGDSEQIFQKAIQEQGRGQNVPLHNVEGEISIIVNSTSIFKFESYDCDAGGWSKKAFAQMLMDPAGPAHELSEVHL